ncbi:hypothetical protein PGT21_016385 [Puccinia graminis f. sp. tritici]|uniref:Uncharacterized protein n=1 Tax=Puccinia graminis f. sp. tritici TaxID=56615 RepID=A0A5B0PID7_PUCGR|nr:hypothetical protein PGTUg99_021300 [Puccinia graminis f. sp. tritici]KAA1099659.1 hypothetical protein PGT21_016385 [Puccinia graminis f. sp. tritici]
MCIVSKQNLPHPVSSPEDRHKFCVWVFRQVRAGGRPGRAAPPEFLSHASLRSAQCDSSAAAPSTSEHKQGCAGMRYCCDQESDSETLRADCQNKVAADPELGDLDVGGYYCD